MKPPISLHFKFESRLAKLLGRQSVTNERDAVYELVKNAYDADSTEVFVSFENISEKDSKIIISDNGTGMTREDFENKFMVVATSSRVRDNVSPSGRYVVGEKGIGRFAMERLGRRTTITSYPKNKEKGYKLTIEWDRYEVEGRTFEEIGNTFEIFTKKDSHKHGTIITNEFLRDPWSETKIVGLNRKLGLLITPAGFKTKLPFNIVLTASEFGIKKTPIKSNLFSKAPYKLKSILKDNKIQLIVWEKNKKIISVEHQNSIIEDVEMRCGPATYHMWGFPIDKPGESYWSRWYGQMHLGAIEGFVRENQGIKIYRDGFRVMPYGEKGIDWTDRAGAARRASGVLPIHSMVGWIEISSAKNPDLITTTTRHRLIEDEKYNDLRNFVLETDKVLDKYMHERRVKRRQEERKSVPDILDLTAKRLNKLNIPDEIKKPLIINLKDSSAFLREQEDEHERERERLMYKIEAYRNLASLGISTATVAHELNVHLGNIIAISERLKRHLEKKHLSNLELMKMSIELYASTKFVQDYMSHIRQFTSTLKSNEPSFRKKSEINVKNELGISFEWFENYFERFNIQLIIDLPEDLNVYMFSADFQSIFMNLLSNSIKAFIRERKELNEIDIAKKKNKIRISMNQNPRITNLEIVYSNDGPAVNPRISKSIFDSFVSDYDELDKSTMGSGLGLSLTREIIESYGGEIELVESEFEPGVTFKITFPWGDIKKP